MVSSLCNNAKLVKNEEDQYQILGDPTEGALIVVAEKAGIRMDDVGKKY